MSVSTEIAVRRDTSPALHTFVELERMAVAVAKSGLFGVRTPEAALSLMLLAQAEGRHPAIAARDYHIIEGRPSLKADAMLARFTEAGGKYKFLERSDVRCACTFTAPGGEPELIEWTIEQAKTADLNKKDVWRKYPRSMLRSRVVSEGIRTTMPSVIVGTYTPEEILDGDADIRDVTPRNEPLPTPVAEKVIEAEFTQKTETPTTTTADTDKRITEEEIKSHIAAMEAATDENGLRREHALAYTIAKAVNDFDAIRRYAEIKDGCKLKLIAAQTAAAQTAATSSENPT